ncbi:MAG: hydantoinase B/oxoprolinase family protein, partial [Chloroflexota bacterium]|nr:hydantoinase B/oxoprolinase family protein [Chloroflexota bacterium]
TWGSVFVAIASQLFWEIPGNAGIVRPLRLIAPEGSLVNVPFLVPCSLCPPTPGRAISNVVTSIIGKMYYTNEKHWGDINASWCAQNWTGAFWGGMTQHGYNSAGMFGDVWARGTGAGIDEGRGDGCDTGALQMTIESCISDVEMNELMYPFLYLWRREGKDTAGPGRWRGGASVSFAVVPHNTSSLTIAFRGTGKYANESQSLDGAYPPSLGDQGPATIIYAEGLPEALAQGGKPDSLEEIRKYVEERGGMFRWVEPCQASQRIGEDDIILSVNAGGGGVGDPLDREPERVLDDVQRGIFSLEMASRVFGVVIAGEAREIDWKATEAERSRIRARRRERGKVWEGGSS